jgi:hypothetical protein
VSFRLRYADGNMPSIYLAPVPKPTISGFVLLTVSGRTRTSRLPRLSGKLKHELAIAHFIERPYIRVLVRRDDHIVALP